MLWLESIIGVNLPFALILCIFIQLPFVCCHESDALEQPMFDIDGEVNRSPPPDPSISTEPDQMAAGPNIEGTAMSFEPPKVTEEESLSNHIPNHLRCDSCQAVIYQIAMGILEFQSDKRWGETKAPESDVAELFEKICEPHRFENYGIKEVSSKNRLSGPGLPTADTPGMMQGGGKWPSRLSMMCLEFTGDVDEYFIYKVFLKAEPSGLEKLHFILCMDEVNDSTGSCINDDVEPVLKEPEVHNEL